MDCPPCRLVHENSLPIESDLAAGELLDWLQIVERGDSCEAVPDRDQAGAGPIGGELGQFLLGRKRL
jgi:hypothetical protein